jgi:hypothetical protein
MAAFGSESGRWAHMHHTSAGDPKTTFTAPPSGQGAGLIRTHQNELERSGGNRPWTQASDRRYALARRPRHANHQRSV